MTPSLIEIPWLRLSLVLLPLVFLLIWFARWHLPFKGILYASFRMLLQLIAIGFALTFIFNLHHPLGSLLILSVMIFFASWIALRPVPALRKTHLAYSLLSIFLGGVPILALVIGAVIRLDPWYEPRYLIPIAGMIFAQSMNSVSLAADRFHSELHQGAAYEQARNASLKTALLPMTNAFFAVGLVSLPGMMTGQILAGVDPMIAIRYQIMVMGMLFGSVGISSLTYLILVRKKSG